MPRGTKKNITANTAETGTVLIQADTIIRSDVRRIDWRFNTF